MATVNTSNFTPVIGEPIDFGQAISLNGSAPIKLPDFFTTGEVNDVVEIFQDSSNFSVMGWIKPASLEDNNANIVYTERPAGLTSQALVGLKINDSGNLSVVFNSGDGFNSQSFELGNGEITAGNWSSIAVTFDSGTLTYYANGNKYEQSGLDSTITATSDFTPERTLIIGGDAEDNNYEGQLDELSFWKRTLSETEVRSFLYNERPTGSETETGLVAYYTFDNDEVKSGEDTITIRDLVKGDTGTITVPIGNGKRELKRNNNGILFPDGGTSVSSNVSNFIGYIDITLDAAVTSELGMIIQYELDTTETQGIDIYNSQIDISTTDDSEPFDGVFIPQGEDSARIYLTALPDAIIEDDATITLNLLEYDADLLAPFEEYDLGTDISQTFTLYDTTDSFDTGLAIANVFGEDATSTNLVADEDGNSFFKVKLTSEPTDTVTVTLSPSDGTLSATSLSFDADNWDTFQEITVSGLTTTDDTAASITVNTSSGDTNYAGIGTTTLTIDDDSDDLKLKVTEGGTTEVVTPTVSISATNDATEGQNQPGVFTVSSDVEAPDEGLRVFYSLSDDSNVGTEYEILNDFGESIDFEGDGDRVNIPSGTTVDSNTFSMMAWVKPDEIRTSNIERYVTYESEAAVLRSEFGQLHFYMKIDGTLNHIRVSNVLVAGEWQHIAGTYDGTTMRLYHNGVEVGTNEITATTPFSNTNSILLNSPGETFIGQLDEVSIWNRTLTQAEIEERASQSLDGDEIDLVGYWNFDNEFVDGTTITEVSGNSNNGTIIAGDGDEIITSDLRFVDIAPGETTASIVLDAIDDQEADGDVTVTVNLEADASYLLNEDTDLQTATLSVVDNESAVIELARIVNLVDSTNDTNDLFDFEITNFVSTATGANATISVALKEQPTTTVTLALADGNGTTSSSFTFDSSNYETSQSATLSLTEDTNGSLDLLATTDSNGDTNYADLSIDLPLTQLEVEIGSRTSLTTSEAGDSLTFGVRLNSQPTAAVTLDLGISDSAEAQFVSSEGYTDSLTFSTTNWDTYQIVTIEGIDDGEDDGNEIYTVSVEVNSASAATYDADPTFFAVTNQEGEFVGNITEVTSDSTIIASVVTDTVVNPTEGETAQVEFILSEAAATDLTLQYLVFTKTADEADFNFTGEDFTAIREVTIAAGLTSATVDFSTIDDLIDEADETFEVALLPSEDYRISANLLVTSQFDSTSDTEIAIQIDPTENVSSLTLVAGSTLEFGDNEIVVIETDTEINNASATNVPITLPTRGKTELEADTDFVVSADTATTISEFQTAESQTALNLVVIENVLEALRVGISDPNVDSLFLEEGTIIELSGGAIIEVNADTTIINDPDGSTLLLFNITDDSPVQSRTAIQSGETSVTTFTSIGGNENVDSTATLTIVDNDDAGLTFTQNGTSTDEAGTTEPTIDVVLDTQPQESVFVYLASSDSSEALLSDEDGETDASFVELIFTPENWNTSQQVTVTGVDDDVEDGEVDYNVLTNIVSADYEYNEDTVNILLTSDVTNVSAGSQSTLNLIADEINIADTTIPAGTQLVFTNGTMATVDETTSISINNTTGTDVKVIIDEAPDFIGNGSSTTALASDGSTEVDIIVASALDSNALSLQLDDEEVTFVTLTRPQQLQFDNGIFATIREYTPAEEIILSPGDLGITDGGVEVVATNQLDSSISIDSGEGETDITATIGLRLRDDETTSVTLPSGTEIIFDSGSVFTLTEAVTLDNSSSSTSVDTTWESDLYGLSNLFGSTAVVDIDTTQLTTDSLILYEEELGSTLSYTNTDDDEGGINVTLSDPDLAIAEGNANNFFNIVLNSEPTEEVEITIIPSDNNISLEDEVEGESVSVVFDSSNWNLPRTIEVTAVDDTFVEFDHTSTISFNVTTGDDVFSDSTLVPGDIEVFIQDNDLPTASIESVAAAIEANAPGYFAISLDTPVPDDFDETGLEVSYTISGTADTDGTFPPTDDVQTISGTTRIAPGATSSPLIAFPIDDFKVEAVPLVVNSFDDASNSVSLSINTDSLNDILLEQLIETGSITIDQDTELSFSGGAVVNTLSEATLTISQGKAAVLDGIDDYIEIPSSDTANNFDTDEDFTVEAWIKADDIQPDTGNNDNDIIEKWSGSGGYPFVIRYDRNTGQIRVARWDTSNNPTIISTTVIKDAEFHHVAFVKDGETLSLYIDGELEGTTTDTTTNSTQNSSALNIGRRGNDTNYFAGNVDELRIWNTARSENEIKNNLNTTLTGTESNLVAYYNFDEDSRELITDSSTTGNDGTFVNGGNNGTFVNAISLDGVDDEIQIPSGVGGFGDFGNSNFTIEAWFKTTESDGTLIGADSTSDGQFWRVYIEDGLAKFGYAISDRSFSSGSLAAKGTASSSETVNDGEWHHIAAVRDGFRSGILYIDGEQVGSFQFDVAGPFDITSDVFIGNFVGSDYFGGTIDEVRVWDTDRSQTEIQENLSTDLTGSESNLVAYYTFDNDSGTTITDQSGNGNTGTLSGTTLATDGVLVSSLLSPDARLVDTFNLPTGTVEVEFTDDRPVTTIAEDETALVREESVIVTLDESEDYQVSSDADTATLKIQDNDRVGVRIVEIGDSTTVTEGETGSEFFVSLLSEPEADVTVTLSTEATSTATIVVTEAYDADAGTIGLEVKNLENPEISSLLLPAGTYTFDNGTVTLTEAQLIGSALPLIVAAGYDSSTGEITLAFDASQTNDTGLTLTVGTELRFDSGASVTVDETVTFDETTTQNVVSVTLDEGTEITTEDSLINPTSVTVTLDGDAPSVKETADYSYTELQFANGTNSESLTFTSDNWFELQSVTVEGVDDAVVETGDLHTGLISYSVSSDDSFYDGLTVDPQTINIRDRVLDSQETAQSVTQGLLALQDSIENISLPIIGDFGDVAPSFFDEFIGNVAAEIRATDNLTGDSLAEAFNVAISESIDVEGLTVEITGLSTDEISLFLGIEDSFEESVELNSDLGLPALNISLESEGSLDLDVGYNAGLAFGINTTDGFFLDTENTSFEVSAGLNFSEDFSATGELGFVQVDVTNGVDPDEGDEDGTGIDANFTVSFAQPDSITDEDGDDTRLTLSELIAARNTSNIFDFIDYSFTGDAALDLDFVTSIEGNTAFPTFGFNLGSDLTLFNYGNEEDAVATSIALDFNDLTLDAGGFVTDLISPVISGINDAVEPISPVIDALTAEIKLLESIGLADLFDQDGDGAATVLEVASTLAETFGEGKFNAVPFINAVSGVIGLTETLAELEDNIASGETIALDFGSYSLDLFGASDDEDNDASDLEIPDDDSLTDGSNQSKNTATVASTESSINSMI